MASVAFIHPFIFRYPRGIERYTINLSSALVRQGVEASILTWAWPRPISWAELDSRVRVRVFPTARYHAARMIVPFYAAHLARHRYDMVYLHFADYGEAGAMQLLRWFRHQQPYSIVLHFPYSQVPHRYQTMIGRGLLDNAVHVIAVSEHVAQEAEAYSGRTCTVISHGVDAHRFRPDPVARLATRAGLEIPERAPVLLTVAALEERKGVQWVLRSLPYVLRERPDVHYIVIGDGPHRAQLQQLASHLDVAHATHFLTPQSEVARFYQAADLFLILAQGEASSIVSLEAMACEVPVIASCAPPFDELIKPAWGQQVDEQHNRALARKVLDLLENESRRKEMGQQGRHRVLTHHDWNAVAQQYLQRL